MKESLAQRKIIDRFKKAGYVVWNLSDRFTPGVPDLYVAKAGHGIWLEAKVTNVPLDGICVLDDRTSKERGFTRIQQAKALELINADIPVFGALWVTVLNEAYQVYPDRFLDSVEVRRIPEEFLPLKP